MKKKLGAVLGAKQGNEKRMMAAKLWLVCAVVNAFSLLNAVMARAQSGEAGINEATNQVAGYFDAGCNLVYAICAVVGLIGAVKVFNKWNAGEPDTNKVAAAWFGSCVFAVIVATVLKSFFGV